MNQINFLFQIIVSVAIISTIVLSVGAIIARRLQQPIEQVRCIQWTFAALLIAMALRQIAVLPAITLNVLPSTPNITAINNSAIDLPSAELLESSRDKVPSAIRTSLEEPIPLTVVAYEDSQSRSDSAFGGQLSAALPASKGTAPIKIWQAVQLAVVVIFTLGATLWIWLMLFARLQLKTMLSNCSPISTALLNEWQRCSPVPTNIDEHQLILVSPTQQTPITFGVRNPVIVLPKTVIESMNQQNIFYCLSHEYAHVKSRDFLTWSIVNYALAVLWFQPLSWYLRKELRFAQDTLADDFATGQDIGGDRTCYAELLAGMAKKQIGPVNVVALTMADRRSSLFRRVESLLSNRQPLAKDARRRMLMSTTVCFTLIAASIGTLRVSQAVARPLQENQRVAKPDAESVELHYNGIVINEETGEPIDGATVTIRLSQIVFERAASTETTHTTGMDGKYEFTISKELAANEKLYVELDVEHPDFGSKKGFGYSLSMIRKNQRLGAEPFFSKVNLHPSDLIVGRVVNPKGHPVSGAVVFAYSRKDPENFRDQGSFFNTKTDEEGNFRLKLVKGGPAVAWVLPQEFSPLQIVVGQFRGNWGDIHVKEGHVIRGKALTAEGKPLAGAWVNFVSDPAVADERLRQFPVSNALVRSAKTKKDGSYSLRPLNTGKYEVVVSNRRREFTGEKIDRSIRRPAPLSNVFLNKTVEIGPNVDEEREIIVQAFPHIEFHAQTVDSKGDTCSGHMVLVNGEINDKGYFAKFYPNETGKIFGRLPFGLLNAKLTPITNEHGALRVRLKKEGPFLPPNNVDLGIAAEDFKGIEILRYRSPVVLIKPVDSDGKLINHCEILGNGVDDQNANVGIRKQSDGRHRTSGMLPDRKIKFTAIADGYHSASKTLELAEGVEQEFDLVLQKN